MAYFPNGMTFAGWQAENCFDCLNYRDNGTGSFGCAITDAHFLLDYHKRGISAVLNRLIPDEGPEAGLCQMRLTQEQLEAEDRARNLQLDLERYEAAMAEIRDNSSVARAV
jgi:hypothetical protein